RLLHEQAAKDGPVSRVVYGLGDGTPKHAGHTDHRVQSRVIDLGDDRLDPASLVAEYSSGQGAELDLGGGEAAPAELVLQPLELKARVRPLGDEAGQAARCLGEGEEEIEYRMGAKPFVPRELVEALANRLRACRVGT